MALPNTPLTLGLIGFGTVGQAFAAALKTAAPRLRERLGAQLRITHVAVADRHRPRATPFPGSATITDDVSRVLRECDIVVEASGAPDAASWIRTAVSSGQPIISANKAAIASCEWCLRALAQRSPLLYCEGAVAAAVPIVRALRDSLAGEEVVALRGILNGTTTFILSAIESGQPWGDALAKAHELGLAEPGAEADLDASDAAAKLAILATIAWRTPITTDRVARRGISENIAELVSRERPAGARVRLVAEAWRPTAPLLVVEPRVLAADDPLAAVDGANNAVEIQAALAGTLRWFGPGAGGARTASGLLGDLIAAVQHLSSRSAQVAA